ncbi:hypothetical protein STEG23_024562, partial [Scotinomys teguina]
VPSSTVSRSWRLSLGTSSNSPCSMSYRSGVPSGRRKPPRLHRKMSDRACVHGKELLHPALVPNYTLSFSCLTEFA